MKVSIEGKIHKVGPIQTFGNKGFMKRNVVVEVVGTQGTSLYAVEFTGDRANRVDDEHVGLSVTVEATLKSRSWDDNRTGETKWFTSLEANEVKLDEAAQAPYLTSSQLVEDDEIPF